MDRRAEIGVAVPGVVEQTKAEIRFALNQLAARNGQHEFETLSRMLARAADKLGAPYKDLVDDAIAGAGVSGLLGSFIDGLSGKGPLWWDEMDTDQHVAHIVQ